MSARVLIAMALAAAAAAPAAGQEQKEGVAVTVYNGNYAVVRELRKLDIGKDGLVKFTDVARHIDPTTVHFKSLTEPAAKLMEQNYQYDLVSAEKLLAKYVDKPIQVICPGKTYSGSLLSFDGQQLVLKGEDGIVMVQRPDNVRDIRFPVLPEGLLTRPTLVWLVATDKPGEHLAEVTYQTAQMNWHAEYVMVLGADDKTADLSGWVSVDNKSGKTYREAKIKCIAGDVRRVAPPPAPARARMYEAAKAVAAPMAEKAFFEYHMYTLPRPSTVADNEVKQLEMFAPVRGMAVQKRFLYDPLRGWRWYGGQQIGKSYGLTTDKKVNIFIEFKNSKDNKLGIPLPAGKVRVYKQDPDDEALEFVGEEQIDHTPRDEELSLQIGNAFDLIGERVQTGFQYESARHWIQEQFKITLRNHKEKEDVVIRVKEHLYRWSNWKITAKSHEYEKLDARTIVFDVPVKADGEVVVTYTVEYNW